MYPVHLIKVSPVAFLSSAEAPNLYICTASKNQHAVIRRQFRRDQLSVPRLFGQGSALPWLFTPVALYSWGWKLKQPLKRVLVEKAFRQNSTQPTPDNQSTYPSRGHTMQIPRYEAWWKTRLRINTIFRLRINDQNYTSCNIYSQQCIKYVAHYHAIHI